MTVNIDHIRATAKAIEAAVIRMPCPRSHSLSDLTGASIHLKFENLHPSRTGARFTSSWG
jgi:threonine dehydratase